MRASKAKRATREEANAAMATLKLKAKDFTGKWVVLCGIDHSQLLYPEAILRTWREWVFIYTEHHGYHAIPKDELQRWAQFEEVDATPLLVPVKP